MSTVPRQLLMTTSTLTGFSRNRYRLESISTQSIGPNRRVSVSLPENSILDLRSFRMIMEEVKGECAAESTATPQTTCSILPAAHDLIYSTQVFANGIALDNGTPEINTVSRILDLCQQTQPKGDSCCALTDGKRSTQHTPHATAAGNDAVDVRNMSCRFRGLLGQESSVRYLNSSLTGSLQCQLQTAGKEVCMNSAASGVNVGGPPVTTYATAAVGPPIVTSVCFASDGVPVQRDSPRGFSITKYHFVIDALTLSNGMYESMLRQRIQDVGWVSVNFKAYNTYLNSLGATSQGSAKFSLSSASIDKLYGTLRRENYNTGQYSGGTPAVPLALGTFTSFGATQLSTVQYPKNLPPNSQEPAGRQSNQSVPHGHLPGGSGQVPLSGVVNTSNPVIHKNADLPGHMAQIPAYFTFSNFGDCLPANPAHGIGAPQARVDNPFSSQWTINSVRHPQTKQNELENAIKSNLYAAQEGKKTAGNACGSLRAYRYVGFVDTQRLNFETGGDMEASVAMKSGYNSRGVSAQLVWSVDGVNPSEARQMLVIVESTSELRIGAGRQLSCVF